VNRVYIVFSKAGNFVYLKVLLFRKLNLLKSLRAACEKTPFLINIEKSFQNLCGVFMNGLLKYIWFLRGIFNV
jgi:hypothetical protein